MVLGHAILGFWTSVAVPLVSTMLPVYGFALVGLAARKLLGWNQTKLDDFLGDYLPEVVMTSIGLFIIQIFFWVLLITMVFHP